MDIDEKTLRDYNRYRIRYFLVDLARQKFIVNSSSNNKTRDANFIYYSDLVYNLRLNYDLNDHFQRMKLGADLDYVSIREYVEGRPLLSALVIRKEEKTPGRGFYEMAKDCKKFDDRMNRTDFALDERKRVIEYWQKNGSKLSEHVDWIGLMEKFVFDLKIDKF